MEEIFVGFMQLCGTILILFGTAWFLIYVPMCSWHSYQDDLSCKQKTGLYNCEMKSKEHTEHLKIGDEK